MLAFHNDPAIKEKYLRRVIAHREADEIIKGVYWDGEKGCAIGCTLELEDETGDIHEQYEIQLGIPRILAELQDRIFERLAPEGHEFFPEHFLRAADVGADLTKVWPQFAVWLLVDPEDGVIKYAKDQEAIKAIRHVADLYQQTEHVTKEQWRNAAYDAYAAEGLASDAADAAADAAAYAARATAYAADGWAAEAADYAGDAAANAASNAAADAAGAETNRDEVFYAAYRKQADKLLELISNIKKEI